MAEAARTEVKCAADGEGDSSKSKRGTYQKIAHESQTKIAKYTVENGIAAAISTSRKTGIFQFEGEVGRMHTVAISAGEREVM